MMLYPQGVVGIHSRPILAGVPARAWTTVGAMNVDTMPLGPLTVTDLRESVSAADIRKSYVGIWRGVYRRADQPEDFEMLCRALAVLNPQGVLTGRSAGQMWGDDSVPAWVAPEIWLPKGRGAAAGRRYRTGAMPDSAVTRIDGVAVTTLPRTVVDLSRELSPEAMVVALERLARRNPELPELMSSYLDHPSNQHQISHASRSRVSEALGQMDPKCLNLSESVARTGLVGSGLSGFEVGYRIRTARVERRVTLADPVSGIAVEAVDDEVMAESLVSYDETLRELQEAGWSVVVASGPLTRILARGTPVTWHHEHKLGRADRVIGAAGRRSQVIATLDCLFSDVRLMSPKYFGYTGDLEKVDVYSGPGPEGWAGQFAGGSTR